jgi:hypothetical protein
MAIHEQGIFVPDPENPNGLVSVINGFLCRIGQGAYADTWTVTVNGERVVRETDDLDYAKRQAARYAESLELVAE